MTPDLDPFAAPQGLRLAEAQALAARGDDEAAKRAYLDLLRGDPALLPALLELARLALRGGHRSAARTLYQQAIFCHPAEPAARVNLGNLLIETGEFETARAAFVAALAAAPSLAAAHQGLARVLTALGEAAMAEAHWRQGFAAGGGWLAPQPYHGTGEGVRILVLVSARGGNIPTRTLLDDTVFAVTALYAEFYDPAQPLPPHQLVFNAIGDADLCADALAKARQIVAASPAPVVNAPGAVARTGRAANARRLAGLADVVVPQIRAMRRDRLLEADDLAFPLLVRSPGFNTGQHFVRIDAAAALAPAMAALPGDALLAIEPLDCRSPDGGYRKYRAMLIGGAIYPMHLAISADWKVHYFSAAMAERADHRAEEAAFLADMPTALGPRAMAGLAAIGAAMGLDYAGVDFALAPDGRLQLFEANPGMVINPPGPEPIWDYRRAPIGRALAAVKALLLTRAQPAPSRDVA
ncbi:MAG TPA: tetratricopeptide repeat protein [Caulobacteraceae bacterium]|nr:tetratricopeptide repeat protein [Caulobacteraceae bacterium]